MSDDQAFAVAPLRILAAQTLYYPVEPSYSIMATTVVLWATSPDGYMGAIGHGTPAWVAEHGHRMPYMLARSYFPDIRVQDYRNEGAQS